MCRRVDVCPGGSIASEDNMSYTRRTVPVPIQGSRARDLGALFD